MWYILKMLETFWPMFGILAPTQFSTANIFHFVHSLWQLFEEEREKSVFYSSLTVKTERRKMFCSFSLEFTNIREDLGSFSPKICWWINYSAGLHKKERCLLSGIQNRHTFLLILLCTFFFFLRLLWKFWWRKQHFWYMNRYKTSHMGERSNFLFKFKINFSINLWGCKYDLGLWQSKNIIQRWTSKKLLFWRYQI